MKKNLLPYFDERKTDIDMLVLHSFATDDFVDSCIRNRVSAHYFIDTDGTITKLVEEKDRAWHAGVSSWRGIKTDINSHSIGIEVKNHDLGQSAFKTEQIESLIGLCKKIIKKYNIKPENIVGHSDIAPTRKADPGFAFPWKKLAREGIGLWYQIRNAGKTKENNIAKLLGTIGYNTETPNNINASAYAFCRRFLKEYVNTDSDIRHLVDNVVNTDFNFINEEKFLNTLKAVAYTYDSLSSNP